MNTNRDEDSLLDWVSLRRAAAKLAASFCCLDDGDVSKYFIFDVPPTLNFLSDELWSALASCLYSLSTMFYPSDCCDVAAYVLKVTLPSL